MSSKLCLVTAAQVPILLAACGIVVALAGPSASAPFSLPVASSSTRNSECSTSLDRRVVLADYDLRDQARELLAAGKAPQASHVYARLEREHPESLWIPEALLHRAHETLARGEPRQALEILGAIVLPASAPRLKDRLELIRAEAYVALYELRTAYEILTPLRERSNPPDEATAIAGRLEAASGAALGLTTEQLELGQARAALAQSRLDDAARRLAALNSSSRSLSERSRAEALLLTARLHRAQGQTRTALDDFGQAAAFARRAGLEQGTRPSSEGSPEAAAIWADALFEAAQLAWKLDVDFEAENRFAEFVDAFPQNARAADATYAMARLADSRGDPIEAAARFRRCAMRFPAHRLAEECTVRAGLLELRRGSIETAAETFSILVGREAGLYWHGEASRRAGDSRRARWAQEQLAAEYPHSAYLWWVEQRDRRERSDSATLPTQIRPLAIRLDASSLSPRAAYHATRATELRCEHRNAEALAELDAVAESDGPSLELISAYTELGAHGRAVRAAQLLGEQSHEPLDSILYPAPFLEEFERAGSIAGIDPLLLLSIARQESLFDPDATSSAGARGLLQLMPATASQTSGRLIRASDLSDPWLNIETGAHHLRHLLDRFGGRLILAVAAYNAGTSPVLRWQQDLEGLPGDEFMEHIPYRETRSYVKLVLRNYRAYTRLYGLGSPLHRNLY